MTTPGCNRCVVLLAYLGLATVAADDVAARLDPAAPYRAERVRPVTYDAELLVAVTAPYKTRQLRVWLPLPPSDAGQEVASSELSTFPGPVRPQIASEPVFGNQFAYFEFADPQGAQVIRHKFRIRVWELRWNLDGGGIQPVAQWPESFAPYRRSESQGVVWDTRFERLLAEIVPQRRGPFEDLGRVMSWVDEHFTYDHARASLQASALHGLEHRGGHCSDYHGFCAAMGRMLGHPTRVVYGMHAFPKSSPSHCKLEAFLPPLGWVSFDVSETQRQVQSIHARRDLSPDERAALAAAARRRLAGGFRDNTWFALTRGTDYELAPPASTRVAVVRTIYAEADGRPLPEPDPANPQQAAFAWMTAHRFVPDREVAYPFADVASLREWPGLPPNPPTGATP